MGAEHGRAHVGRGRSERALAEEYGQGVPRDGGDDAQASCAAEGGRDDSGGWTRGGSDAGARFVPLIAPLKHTNSTLAGGLRVFVQCFCLALLVWALAWPATAQQRAEVAITVDDLPSHGDLPSTMKRSDVAKSMIATFKAKGVPAVYGFVNAKWVGDDQDKADVLKIWVDAGFPLGNHTFSHIDINTATPEAFESEIAADEPTLQGLMGAKDWHWLRYPYLHEGDTLEKRHAVRNYLKEHGCKRS